MQTSYSENFRKKLIWVMLFRIILVSILLVATLIRHIRSYESAIRLDSSFIVLIIISAYLASLVYLYLLRQSSWYRLSAILQIVGDMLFSTLLCYFTGKDGSIFTIFFAFTTIISAILFVGAGSYIAAAISSIIIVIFAIDRQLLFLPYIPGMIIENTKPSLDQMVYSVFIHILAYVVIAQLSSYLSTELKTTSEQYYAKKRAYDILFDQYRAIVENLSDGVLLFKNNRPAYINDIAASIFGISKNSIEELEKFSKIKEVLDRLNLSSGGEIESLSDGKKRFVSIKHKRRVYEDGSTDDIYVVSDLTEGRRLQEEIIRSEKLASIGKVATGFAHEIRNPLSSILGSIELVKKTTAFDEENSMLMDIIVKELLRVNELIERFLMFARPTPPRFSMIDIGRVISEVVELIRFDKDYRDTIRIEIRDEFKREIVADPSMLKQVFWNLIKNSLQAIKERGEITISIRGRETDFIEVEVRDTGCGIPQTETDRIFDPFYSSKEKSIGIGLSIVHSIIKEHKGKVIVESVLNKGTAFKILLPVKQGES